MAQQGTIRSLTNMAERLSAAWAALNGRPFGPGQPLTPVAPQESPRQYEYPVASNQRYEPRRDFPDLLPFEQLRSLAASYDVAALCIATRIEEMCGLQYAIVAKDKRQQQARQSECDEVAAFWQSPDKLNEFSAWLSMLLYDLFSIDAPAIYVRPDRVGRLYGLEVVDGATIKPLLDDRGRTLAYQQVIHGRAESNFRRTSADTADETLNIYAPHELIYRPRWVRSYSAYGSPPTEWIIIRVNTALRKQGSDLARFTDGNIPDMIAFPPEGSIDPKQVQAFQEWFNATLSGNSRERAKIRFLPWAANLKDLGELSEGGRYESALDEWMLKITCAAYGVTPSEMGFTDDVNRATAESQEGVNFRRGLIPLTVYLKHLFDRIIQLNMGHPDLEWRWMLERHEDKLVTAQTDQIYGGMGVLTPDELRTMRFGDDLNGPAPGVPLTQPNDDVATAPFSRLAKEKGKDEDPRLTWEERARAVFGTVYRHQADRIRAVLKTRLDDGNIAWEREIEETWKGESILVAQSVLPFFDDVMEAATGQGFDRINLAADWDLVNEPALRIARERASMFAEQMTNTSQSQLSQVIADWVATGGKMDDLISRAEKVWRGSRADIAAINEVTGIFAEGNRLAWEESGVVKEWEWDSANDSRVCTRCQSLHGTRHPIKSRKNLPPGHGGCRCDVSPVVKDPKEL